MKKVQIMINNNGYRQYVDVIVNNEQTLKDAIAIVRRNCNELGISSLADISRGNGGIEHLSQYNKYKAGTILDGDWNSFNFGQVLVEDKQLKNKRRKDLLDNLLNRIKGGK